MGQIAWGLDATKADSLRRSGNYAASIPIYKKVLKSIGNSDQEQKHTYQIRIGLSYLMLPDNEKADNYFSAVIKETEKDTLNIFRAHALNNLGLLCDNQGAFKRSVDYYKKASRIYQALDNQHMVDLTKMNIGIVYKKVGRYKEGLKYLLESAEGFKRRDNISQLGEVYSSIGGIQDLLGDKQKAKQFYYKSIKIRKEIKDLYGLSSVYNNLGIIYMDNGTLDSAVYYYQNSIRLMQKTSNRNLGSVYHNLGMTYQFQNKIDEARTFFTKALKEKYEIADTSKIVYTLNKLALLEIGESENKTAVKYLSEGRKLLSKNRNKRTLKEHLDVWKEYYKEVGNVDSALYYLEQSNELLKEINQEDYLKELALLQESFEANERNQEIGELNTENKEKEKDLSIAQKMILHRNWIIGGSIFLVFLLLIILYVRKQRSAKRELQAKLKGVELEKNRLSAELHDVAGTRLRDLKRKVQLYSEKGVDNQEILPKIHSELSDITRSVINVSHELKLPDFKTSRFSVVFEDVIFDWFEGKDYEYVTRIQNR